MIGALILDEDEIAAFEKWTFDRATKPTPIMIMAAKRHAELRARQQANLSMNWDRALTGLAKAEEKMMGPDVGRPFSEKWIEAREMEAAVEAMRLKTFEECSKIAQRVAGVEVDGPEHDIGWHAGCWAVFDAITAQKDTKL